MVSLNTSLESPAHVFDSTGKEVASLQGEIVSIVDSLFLKLAQRIVLKPSETCQEFPEREVKYPPTGDDPAYRRAFIIMVDKLVVNDNYRWSDENRNDSLLQQHRAKCLISREQMAANRQNFINPGLRLINKKT